MGVDYIYRSIGRHLDDALTGSGRDLESDPRPEIAAVYAVINALRNEDIWYALDEYTEFRHCVDDYSRKRSDDAFARFVDLTRDIVTPAVLVKWATDRAEKAAADARAAADMVDAMIAKAKGE